MRVQLRLDPLSGQGSAQPNLVAEVGPPDTRSAPPAVLQTGARHSWPGVLRNTLGRRHRSRRRGSPFEAPPLHLPPLPPLPLPIKFLFHSNPLQTFHFPQISGTRQALGPVLLNSYNDRVPVDSVIRSGKYIALYFSASWCAAPHACNHLLPPPQTPANARNAKRPPM